MATGEWPNIVVQAPVAADPAVAEEPKLRLPGQEEPHFCNYGTRERETPRVTWQVGCVPRA